MEDGQRTPRSDNFGKRHLNNDPLLDKKYFSKFRTIKKLGEGSFGKVYKAEYNNEYYALKFENRTKGQNLLENEALILSYLKGPNIPEFVYFDHSGEYNILVMQFMGQSLEDIFNKKKKFSVKTTCILGYQMLNVLQYIHDKHIIHRDIKPDNFVMGAKANNAHLYLLDFGLAKKYRSSRTLLQYPLIKKKKLTGTARYASIHALEELEQSRRDDLESVGYVLMYFLRGSLPWQGLKVKSKEDRYKKILMKKKETSSEELCQGFPDEFREYMEYTRNMEYTQQPDYDRLRNNFYNLVTKKNKESFDYIYDWTTKFDLKIRKQEVIDLAPSTNYPNSEKKSTHKELESINSKKKLDLNGNPVHKSQNSENLDGNKVIIDDNKDNNKFSIKSQCCIVF